MIVTCLLFRLDCEKEFAPGEARTHGLQIMRLTRCLLRYGGIHIVYLIEVKIPMPDCQVACFNLGRQTDQNLFASEVKMVSQVMRQPGIEPGSTAWKAAMLTTIPLTLTDIWNGIVEDFGVQWTGESVQKCHCRDQDSNLGYCGHNAGS